MTTSPRLTLGLANFRNQVNARFPDRAHTSDGWIGDAAHQAETSGHNPDDTPHSRPAWDGDFDSVSEVRAEDFDSRLNDPQHLTWYDIIEWCIALPHLDTVIRYFIYDGYWWHYRTGWKRQRYTGKSPHREHAHVEGQWAQVADNNTSFDFRLDYLGMPYVDDVANAILAKLADPKTGLINKLLTTGLGSSGTPTVGVALQSGYGFSKASATAIQSVITNQSAISEAINTLTEKVDDLTSPK